METSRRTRKEILQMVEAGQISGQEGMQLLAALRSTPEHPVRPESSADPSDLQGSLETFLRELIAAETKLAVSAILPNQSFEQFGIDSVLVVNLNRRLEQHFGDLSKTLFFEYQTVRELADFFVQHHAERVRDLVGKPAVKQPAPRAPEAAPRPERAPALPPAREMALQSRFVEPPQAARAESEAIAGGIAIIGINGRYPQAADLDEFWKALKEGKDCITEIPRERWDHGQYYDADRSRPGKTYSKWGGFIEGVDEFDSLFFHVSPREADFMDPQERLFLQCVWHTLEDAGYPKSQLMRRSIGVFVGVMYGHYQLFGAEHSLMGNVIALGQSYASIANRVSYWFDWSGPSMGLDSMCSSSLTSIHLACESIRRGECEMAVAGGVNVTIHPNKYVLLSQGKFIASDGRCRSFAEGGDGYVPSEGVGAVLLKPLERAIADGDTIYAVIRGSSLNHGGKTSGYTVPNPNAQAAVVADALANAQIDPRTISYLEAHGTGTSLGDPIEITGLVKAFGQHTKEKQYCPIGAVKSNIGHLESAAGIAGITKVVLQMKYNQLVPTINAQNLNPNINFAASPFYVQRDLEEWRRPVLIENGVERAYPRRAGISSFGAGGSNAHIILEQYEAPAPLPAPAERGPQIVVLSARTPERLKEYARNLCTFLERDQSRTLALADIAYTLHLCREPMEVRIAAVVSEVDELREILRAYEADKRSIRNLYQSDSPDSTTRLGFLFEGEEGQRLLAELVEQRKLDQIAQLWVSGVPVDWKRIHSDRCRRVSLPLYPFAKERHWPPPLDLSRQMAPGISGTALHPLLDANESTLNEQTYRKMFTPDPFYLRDHVVGGQMVLPGVVSLEMARAAGELALPGEQVARMRDIVWEKPIRLQGAPLTAYVSLFPQANEVEYLISTEGQDGERTIHVRGWLGYTEEGEAPQIVPALDLDAVRRRCPHTVEGGQLYSATRAVGMEYGPTLQSIRQIHVGDNECLARLQLSPELNANVAAFGLHPAIMDGALQAIAPLVQTEGAAYLPFSVDRLAIVAPLGAAGYVHVTALASESSAFRLFDLTLYDDQGNPLVVMNRLTAARVELPKPNLSVGPDQPLFLTSRWEAASAPMSAPDWPARNTLVLGRSESVLAGAPGQAVLVLPGEQFREITPGRVYAVHPERGDDFGEVLTALRSRNWVPEQVVHMWAEQADWLNPDQIAGQLSVGVYSLLALTQALMKAKLPHALRTLYLFSSDQAGQQPAHGAVIGFARTLARENPQFLCKTVELVAGEGALARPLWEVLRAELESMSDMAVRFQAGQRQVMRLAECSAPSGPTAVAAKENGVYLITGGMGGLGLIFARHLASQARVKLVLVGRSELDASRNQTLAELKQLGSEAIYLQADVSSAAQAEHVVREAEARCGQIHGVLHCAGVLRDSFILKKSQAEMATVLEPKVFGTIGLIRALAGRSLDFLAFFSSTTAILGNVGQCDYAFANSFLDDLSTAMQGRSDWGTVLSVNWPFWADGGMMMDAKSIQLLEQMAGIVPLTAESGIRVLAAGLVAGLPHFGVIPGEKAKIRQVFGLAPAPQAPVRPAAAQPPQPAPAPQKPQAKQDESEQLAQKTEALLKEIFSQVLRLPPGRISTHDPFERYGIDSIQIMDLTRLLEEQFGELPKTLFFQYQNLGEMVDYFVERHQDRLRKRFATATAEGPAPQQTQLAPAVATAKAVKPRKERFLAGRSPRVSDEPASAEIAIIGLAGRYPGAEDVNRFWELLKNGQDYIREVPADRWDHSAYFDPEKGKPGKSYGKWGSFIDGIDRFDPLFFNISPLEAQILDPQERLFLETAWHTMEDAGYTRSRLARYRAGVFVGVMFGHYELYAAEEAARGNPVVLSSSFASIANRVSYFLNLRGPSIALDTMCSSSLTAIHLACQSLLQGECEVALAGGVNLTVHPTKYVSLSQARFLATDGRCRSFGEGGDGYVPGEGVGAVLLKPLKRAEEEGDRIYAVIKVSLINHGGKVNGYTVPNPNAQAELIAEALRKVEPHTISYVEAHGTGTALGDPIEIEALNQAYSGVGKQVCAIGSVKSNIGHLESAAGIAGLTKVLLQMKHGQLVPSLHADRLNPNIDFANSPFYVQRTLTEWKRPIVVERGRERLLPRRAAISSFGAGGSNAHLIIEEYEPPVPAKGSVSQGAQVVTLSAKNGDRLAAYAQRLLAHLRPVAPAPGLPVLRDQEETVRRIRNELVGMIADLTGVSSDSIDPADEISSYGLDRSSLARLSERLNQLYGIDPSQVVFSSGGSVDQMAHLLWEEFSAAQGGQPAGAVAPVAAEPAPLVNLADLAFTLQIGREPMEERLALVVSSVDELCEKLGRYCNGEKEIPGLFAGNVLRNREQAELLLGSALGGEFIQMLINGRELEGLARVWVAGVQVDWSRLHEGEPRSLLALPGYPFAAERYWVELTQGAAPPKRVAPPQREGALFVKGWKPAQAPLQRGPEPSGSILLLVNDQTEQMAASLFDGNGGLRPVLVRAIECFADPEKGARRATNLLEQHRDLAGVVDLSDLYAQAVDRFVSQPGKIALIQGLLREKSRAPFFLLQLTRGLNGFGQAEPTLAGAECAGFVRMLGAEYKQVRSRTVDLDTFDLSNLRQAVWDEALLLGGETEVCYRRGVRYVPYLTERSSIDLTRPGALPVDPTKVVVITGGTRGIGAEVAKHLVAQGAKRLVLMGLRPVPPRSEWGSLLTQGAEPDLVARVTLVQELERAGATVDLYTGPLTDASRLSAFFDQVRRKMGPIGGVIHSAGLSLGENPSFIHKRPDDMQKVFAPKMAGIETLQSVFAQDALEYVVLFSSVSALVPALAVGLSDYAAANACLDYFASYQSRKGRTAYRSIIWPSWKEVGMATGEGPVYGQLGLLAISTAEGLAMLDAAVSCREGASVVPLVINRTQFDPDRMLRVASPAAPVAPSKAPMAVRSAGAAESWLKQIFAQQLRIPLERLDEDTPFGEYGVDSILLAELIPKIEQRLGRKVEPSALLENPTLRLLGQYLGADGVPTEPMPEVAAAVEPFVPAEEPIQTSPAPAPVQAAPTGQRTKVAVIGIACHFPLASDKEAFWENLKAGKDCITEVPPSRWDVNQFYSPIYQQGKSISKWGGFIDGIEEFDPAYFAIRPEDADQTDPLIRQVLEVSAEAINDAGYDRKELWGQRVGVFVGARAGAFAPKLSEIRKSSILGIGQNFVATRVSHWLNLKGPSVVVDTACSSSLVSVHLACQSLMAGESSLALAGGVDVLLDVGYYQVLSGALSPDGRCHTFDEKANGFVPGEGCGMIMLKLLDQAVADGDQIYAVIEASAVNNDGHNMGVTTPNPEGQADVIRRAQELAAIDPATITYVETHGTGTMIGDPIELKALTTVFRESSADKQFCRVGSVKTNIGHLLSAAGIASIIKVALSLTHRQLPPTLHCERPNPRFRFEDSPFIPCQTLIDWAPRHGVRRAGISSFGFGGTNAHMILSDWQSATPAGYVARRQPLPPLVMNRKRYWMEPAPATAPSPLPTGEAGIMAITEEED